ncbi:hypothetical protein ACFQY9_17850 [Microvirga aerilata]|uniref:hypothetical protein n=1 Tax=Microvirga aerilata TaxID=670292 RepID=UPI00362E66BB
MADVTLMKTPAETALAQAFESAKTLLPGNVESRSQAFELFTQRGLPHRRVEEFKYTDLRAVLRDIAPLPRLPRRTRPRPPCRPHRRSPASRRFRCLS